MSSARSPLAPSVPLLAVFALLVAIGVVGRWGQPDWCVTPLAAVGLLAGYALPRRWAIAVPLTAMLLSDALLPSYATIAVAVTVYAAMTVPALLGSLLRRRVTSRSVGIARLLGLSATPALAFFLTTNFAVWATQSMYPKTAGGLLECYTAALPFFRRMVVGDLSYAAVVFGAVAIAGAFSLTGASTSQEAPLTEAKQEPVAA